VSGPGFDGDLLLARHASASLSLTSFAATHDELAVIVIAIFFGFSIIFLPYARCCQCSRRRSAAAN
jgi:hypothetical protein